MLSTSSTTHKTGNYVIYDVIIWVQDGNCKKMAQDNFSIGTFYNITKNQDNPIKTVGRDSFLSPCVVMCKLTTIEHRDMHTHN